jgi:hypothetical protein
MASFPDPLHAGQSQHNTGAARQPGAASCTPADGVSTFCAGRPVFLRPAADPRRYPSETPVEYTYYKDRPDHAILSAVMCVPAAL